MPQAVPDSSEVAEPGNGSISRNAYNMAKSLDAALNATTASADDDKSKLGKDEKEAALLKKRAENQRQKDIEAEVMGTVKKGVTSQSDIKERNLSQMISVLHMRLAALEKRQAERMDLVKEDVRTDSTRCSSDIKNRTDDLEDFALTRDVPLSGKASRGHRENLVRHSEGVQLDPVHLVLKTKQSTETAKRLEGNLEDAFGTANTRDFRGMKKGKGGGAGGKGGGVKSDQQKYDRKKQQRLKLEKQLQTNMESFVTRSILEPELAFAAPASGEPVVWPITIKWAKKDPRSEAADNADGDMDPLLLLRYAIERTQLPAHEQLFRWLIAQVPLQGYFVYLLWLIKVKFFQNEDDPSHELYLMRELSNYYAVIITLLAERTHAEHEKDHVYKYLPYVLTTAVCYGFHYLCPGSRHLYTKGFRKTVLMQIVQMMNGLQLCPISVKVGWTRLFPEEAHEEEEAEAAGEGGSESIPVQIALTQSKALAESMKPVSPPSPLGLFGPTIEATGGASSKSGKLAGEDGDDDTHLNRSASSASVQSGTDNMGTQFGGASAAGFVDTSHSRPGTAGSTDLHASMLRRTVRPFERTFLQAPADRPGRYFVSKRQNVTTMNAQDVSPLMQSLLGWDTASGEKQQQIFRTVPISWCPAGGSDTYTKRTVPKELHDAISAQVQKSEREFSRESALGHRRKLAAQKLVAKKCAITMSSGQARISQYALDLIKAQRAKERGGKASKKDDDIEEKVDPALAAFDDGDFDEFLAEFD
eukprot:GSChrysophyteH1.ASY1.ANO1.680.1 assembled CDS